MNNEHVNSNSNVLVFTGERFVPEKHGNLELEHLHRYLQASEIVRDKVVLDLACGEGYGSALLAKKAGKVIGVDISTDAILHAQKRYQKENLEYIEGSCAAIPIPTASVDVVVSFETIEHHKQHELMMHEIKRVLRPTGVLLISSPDKQHYSVETGYINPFHARELYQHEFKQLLRNHFTNVIFFGQRVIYGSCIFSESLPTPVSSYLKKDETLIESTGVIKPVYWIALASDVQLPKLASGILEQPINDTEIIQSWKLLLAERDDYIHQLVTSLSWRITKPFQFIASAWHRLIR
ncbi:MAG: class I SAM-dependent methyltransferase [Nitrosomonadales bacterium]|nr:class I SAM-dependent methyltransferase [Nitrosomonadales bacterium]